MNLGPTELIIILIIVLLIFGGSKLPKLARSLGQAKSEFESGVREGSQQASPPVSREPEGPATPPSPPAT